MAISYDDVRNWWTAAEASNELETQILSRIEDYLRTAEKEPETFRMPMFMGLVSFNPDAYSYILKANPEWRAEFQKSKYGSEWNWEPSQVAQLLGRGQFSNPLDMFKKNKSSGIPEWQMFVGDERDPAKMSEILDKFYGEPEGLPSGQLYNWLNEAQKRYDNAQDWGSWGKGEALKGLRNTALKFFAPRSHESLVRRGSVEPRDVIADVAENVIYAANPEIMAAKIGDKLLGLRSLGKYYKPVHATESVAGKAFAPAFTEAGDYYIYNDDPSYNPSRAGFNFSDVLTGTATNMATAPAVAASVSGIGRKAGFMPKKMTLQESMSADPYIDALHTLHEYKYGGAPVETGKSLSQLMLEAELYKKVFGKTNKELEAMQKMQKENWDNWIKTKAPQDVIDNLQRERDEIAKIPDAVRREAKLKEFEANQRYLTPTAILGEDASKYGLSESGQIVDVIPGSKSGLNKSNKLQTSVDENRSAEAMLRAEKDKHIDKEYPRSTEFDEAVLALKNKPDVVALANKKNFGTKAGLTSYITNKLGDKKMGQAIVGADLPNTSEIDEDVQVYLDDPATIRMWEAGFVPRGNEDEPIMRAYRIFKSKEKTKDESSR